MVELVAFVSVAVFVTSAPPTVIDVVGLLKAIEGGRAANVAVTSTASAGILKVYLFVALCVTVPPVESVTPSVW